MPSRRKTKPAASPKMREGARKPRARKSTDRPLRRAAPSAPRPLPEMERRTRNRRAVLPSASQVEPVTPVVMWTVYKRPKDYPDEYVARRVVITEDFTGLSMIE